MKIIAMLMLAADLNGQQLPDVVLLDFTADFCAPCRQMAPIIEGMESRKFPIRKIDFAKQPDLCKQFGVSRIPTFIVLMDGKEVDRFVGLTSEKKLCEAVQKAANDLSDLRRKEKEALQQTADANSRDTANDTQPAAGGIRGFFDRMRNGISGEPDEPNYLGQSPDSANPDDSPEMKATVRIRVLDKRMRDFATGTIIHSVAGQSTIVTCSHAFRELSDSAIVEAELFVNGKALRYPAQLLGTDHETDVAFIQIQNKVALPSIPVAERLQFKKDQPLFSIGCNNGDRPTRLNMNLIEVNGVNGLQNIYCTNPPMQGRSGGGLFDTNGKLVGVCSGILNQTNEGLYSGVRSIRNLAGRLKLPFLQPVESIEAGVANVAAGNLPPNNAAPNDAPIDNPFANEDSLFAEMDAAESAAFGPDMLEPTVPSSTPAARSADPFVTSNQPTNTAANPPTNSNATTNTNVEVTVIINSGDPAKKRVVVIPNPSSWLMQLLTGEAQ